MLASGSATKISAKPKDKGSVLHARSPSLVKSLQVAGATSTSDAFLASIQPAPPVGSHSREAKERCAKTTKTRTGTGTASRRVGQNAIERLGMYRRTSNHMTVSIIDYYECSCLIPKRHPKAYAAGPSCVLIHNQSPEARKSMPGASQIQPGALQDAIF